MESNLRQLWITNTSEKETKPGMMASYIQLHTELDSQDCNPTPQQRAVYSYHEKIHSDAADDIYSSEWFQRTKLFFKQFAKQQKHVTALTSWEMVEDLDFGAFFLAHPVAAYSLWHLLQACYELDRVVCGFSHEELPKVEKWQLLKPFVYLRARKISTQWVKSLKFLKEQIECGALEGDELVRTLYDILCGVEKLIASSAALKDVFAVHLRDMIFVDEMLQKVNTVVDDRCGMIAAHLKLEDSKEISRQESESSSDEASGDSTTKMQNASEKKPKRQHIFPKGKKEEIKMRPLSKPEIKTPERDNSSFFGFIELFIYGFLLIAFGLCICTILPFLNTRALIVPGLLPRGDLLA